MWYDLLLEFFFKITVKTCLALVSNTSKFKTLTGLAFVDKQQSVLEPQSVQTTEIIPTNPLFWVWCAKESKKNMLPFPLWIFIWETKFKEIILLFFVKNSCIYFTLTNCSSTEKKITWGYDDWWRHLVFADAMFICAIFLLLFLFFEDFGFVCVVNWLLMTIRNCI